MYRDHADNHPIANGNKVTIPTVKTIDEQTGGIRVMLRDLFGKNSVIQGVNLLYFVRVLGFFEKHFRHE
jgi:hypothetical protein